MKTINYVLYKSYKNYPKSGHNTQMPEAEIYDLIISGKAKVEEVLPCGEVVRLNPSNFNISNCKGEEATVEEPKAEDIEVEQPKVEEVVETPVEEKVEEIVVRTKSQKNKNRR